MTMLPGADAKETKYESETILNKAQKSSRIRKAENRR